MSKNTRTIEIPEDVARFISELAHEMETQDNRITANPRFYQVKVDREIVGIADGYTDEFLWIHRDTDRALTLEDACDVEDIALEDGDDDGMETRLMERGWEKVGVRTVEQLENCFLTERACREHIDRNRYLYNNPSDFLSHAFRSHELYSVIKAIHAIARAIRDV
jgi:hypothetical protein